MFPRWFIGRHQVDSFPEFGPSPVAWNSTNDEFEWHKSKIIVFFRSKHYASISTNITKVSNHRCFPTIANKMTTIPTATKQPLTNYHSVRPPFYTAFASGQTWTKHWPFPIIQDNYWFTRFHHPILKIEKNIGTPLKLNHIASQPKQPSSIKQPSHVPRRQRPAGLDQSHPFSAAGAMRCSTLMELVEVRTVGKQLVLPNSWWIMMASWPRTDGWFVCENSIYDCS